MGYVKASETERRRILITTGKQVGRAANGGGGPFWQCGKSRTPSPRKKEPARPRTLGSRNAAGSPSPAGSSRPKSESLAWVRPIEKGILHSLSGLVPRGEEGPARKEIADLCCEVQIRSTSPKGGSKSVARFLHLERSAARGLSSNVSAAGRSARSSRRRTHTCGERAGLLLSPQKGGSAMGGGPRHEIGFKVNCLSHSKVICSVDLPFQIPLWPHGTW